ncbi:MAG: ShlB/FhaC/HecB family hemolysin secretion/activation protein [Cyanobacteriota bacterium]|nr:ShlB/FhaC/HecB family hemolysin secretion/activation protein [Cyanobacteriota bacterium]
MAESARLLNSASRVDSKQQQPSERSARRKQPRNSTRETLGILSLAGFALGLAGSATATSPPQATLKSAKIAPLVSHHSDDSEPLAIAQPSKEKAKKSDEIDRPLSINDSNEELAQIQPIEPERPEFPELEPAPLPPPDELLQPSDPDELPSEEILETLPGTITVERYEVVGSTVFTPAEFDDALAEYLGEVSFAELLQARSVVTELYTENGYITSGALIPPQTLDSGIVTIQVVEGRLEDILVTVDGRLNEGYVRSRLERATEAPLNVERLLESLQLLQLNPLVENLSAELSAGSRPGLNLLEVEVIEADTFSVDVFLDNGRSPSVGTLRRGVEVRERDLFGLGDSITLSYKNTDGSNEGEARYSIPINSRNGTIDARFRAVSSEIVEEPFDRLDIEADSIDFELSYRQPVLETPTQELALGLTAARRESDTSLLGVDFPLSIGASDEGETRLSVLRFFQEYTERGAREVFAARSQFSLGIDAFDATVNGIAPDSRFFTWRGQLQYLKLLSESENAASLLLRSDLQLAATSLVPLEQFGVGGFESVRGYRQDELLTDNGLFASAEVRIPILRTSNREGTLQLSPFFDVGTGWNNELEGRTEPDPTTLVAIGLGLAWLQGDDFSARIDWGIRLIDDNNPDRDSLQENGVYFSVRWTPF